MPIVHDIILEDNGGNDRVEERRGRRHHRQEAAVGEQNQFYDRSGREE